MGPSPMLLFTSVLSVDCTSHAVLHSANTTFQITDRPSESGTFPTSTTTPYTTCARPSPSAYVSTAQEARAPPLQTLRPPQCAHFFSQLGFCMHLKTFPLPSTPWDTL